MSLQLIITTAITTCFLCVGLGLPLAGILLDGISCQAADGPPTDCPWHRPQIWSLILQAVIGIGTLVTVATGCAPKGHTSIVGFLVLAGITTLQHAQEIGRGVDDYSKIAQILASVGFLVLFVWDCALVLYVSVGFGRSPASGMRKEIECSIFSYALFLKFAFAVVIGCFMVGASLVGLDSDCTGGGECAIGLKWGAAAFVLLVMIVLAFCDLFGVIEGYDTVLGAAVALAASIVMDRAAGGFPAENTKDVVGAVGFIILSAACLCALIALGMGSGAKGTSEDQPWLKAVGAAFWYSLLPLVFGWALTVAGVAKFSECSGCEEFKEINLTYWTLVFEMVSIILAAVGKFFRLRQLRLPSILFIVLGTVNTMRLINGCMDTNEFWLSMAASGFMLVATMNCVVTVLLGLEDETENIGYTPLIA